MNTRVTTRRRIAALLLTAALVSAGSLVGASSARAVPTSAVSSAASKAAAPKSGVTFGKVTDKSAPAKGKVTVKPNVKKSGKVSVSASTLTVTKGGKTVAKNKTSVKLGVGTYKVTQKVTYRTYTTKTTTTKVKKRVVGVAAGTEVEVTCTASSVEPQYEQEGDLEPFALLAQLSCTSPKFDGARELELYLAEEEGDWIGFNLDFTDIMLAYAEPRVGVAFAALYVPMVDDLMKTTYVTEKTTKKVYSKPITKTSQPQKLVVKKR